MHATPFPEFNWGGPICPSNVSATPLPTSRGPDPTVSVSCIWLEKLLGPIGHIETQDDPVACKHPRLLRDRTFVCCDLGGHSVRASCGQWRHCVGPQVHPWNIYCTNALATEFTPTAVHIRSKFRRGRALNDRRSTLIIVRRVPNAKYPIHPRYTVLGNPSRCIPINPICQFHHT